MVVIDVDKEGGRERLESLRKQGLELTSDETPQFFFKFNNGGMFAPVDGEMVFETLKRAVSISL